MPALSDAPIVFTDLQERQVSYLRLSVTDRCNLRCVYCRGLGDAGLMRHDQVMRDEEMLDFIALAVEHGIEKVRLTGGEPFVRKGFMDFVQRIRAQFPGLDLRITSNGTLVREHASALHELGVRVNISLDSFDPRRFEELTGRDLLPEVRAGLDALLHHGVPVKINAVGLLGGNSAELGTFIDFARNHPVDVRFIEFMPMGSGTRWTQDFFWPADAILEQAREFAELIPLDLAESGAESGTDARASHSGPARMFKIAGGQGRFGVISPVSRHFCRTCNRMRITSQGNLRTCLFADQEYRLLPLLRHPRLGMEAVRRVIARAIIKKPLGNILFENRTEKHVARSSMVSIGG